MAKYMLAQLRQATEIAQFPAERLLRVESRQQLARFRQRRLGKPDESFWISLCCFEQIPKQRMNFDFFS